MEVIPGRGAYSTDWQRVVIPAKAGIQFTYNSKRKNGFPIKDFGNDGFKRNSLPILRFLSCNKHIWNR